MIKLEQNQIMIFNETIKKLSNSKEIALYTFLLSKQQDRIYYESIKEISKEIKMAYKTVQKYTKTLKAKGLLKKYKGVFLVNYTTKEG